MAGLNTKIKNMTPKQEVEKIKEPVEVIELTEEQKQNLLAAWKAAPVDNPPTQKELTKIAFPNLDIDARSKQGKVVKEFFATFGFKPKPATWETLGKYELTVAEKDFIQSNYDKHLDNKMEILSLLFPDKKLSPLSREFKAIRHFITTSGMFTESKIKDDEPDLFTPPRTYTDCLRLVNKYTDDIISIQDASEKDKQGINTLLRYLHGPRFLHMANTYTEDINRDLFVSEFIRACFDKPDLTVDEINLYLNLCSDYVSSSQIKREIELLSKKLGSIMEDEDGRMSTSLADTISAKNKQYNDCLGRQEALINKLNGSRAIRLKNQTAANSSVKSLVEFWRVEKNRQKLIGLAKINEKARLSSVIDLHSMDSIKAELFGAVDENIL